MGRISTSILAISALLVIVDADCSQLYAREGMFAWEETASQEGKESQIVAPTSDAADSATQSTKPSSGAIAETKTEGSANPSDSSASLANAPQSNTDSVEASSEDSPSNPKASSPANTSFSEAFFRNPLNLVLLVFLALYLLLLFLPKQAKKEQKALQARLANLKKNDRVILNSGIHGVVANINSDAGTVTLRVDESSNAKITVDRVAIRSVEA